MELTDRIVVLSYGRVIAEGDPRAVMREPNVVAAYLGSPMLEVERIRVSYGAAPAISEVSIRIGPGELACVVGPNGAGKTTLINAIAGLHSIEAGALRLDGRDLSRLPRHAFCGEGIAIVPRGGGSLRA